MQSFVCQVALIERPKSRAQINVKLTNLQISQKPLDVSTDVFSAIYNLNFHENFFKNNL